MKLRNHIVSLVLGIILSVIGIVFVCLPSTFITSIGVITGSILIVLGVIMLVTAFILSRRALSSIWNIITGVLMVIFGILFLADNGFVISTITIFLFIYLFINGISKIVNSFTLKAINYKFWFINLIYGLILLVLGVTLLFVDDLLSKALGILVGVIFIILGLSLVIDFILKIRMLNAMNKSDEYLKEHYFHKHHKEDIDVSNNENNALNTSSYNMDKDNIVEGEIVDDKTNKDD